LISASGCLAYGGEKQHLDGKLPMKYYIIANKEENIQIQKD
jgi:hypothetical protein